MTDHLRPLERVILRLEGEEIPTPEIAQMVGKRPGTVERILEMINMKTGVPSSGSSDSSGLRPLERVVLRLRSQGESYGLIGNRLGRSGAQVRRIESYANLKS